MDVQKAKMDKHTGLRKTLLASKIYSEIIQTADYQSGDHYKS